VVHIYKSPEGEYFPSVTTIIGAVLEEPIGLRKWRENNADWEQQANKSAIIGTLIHYRILNGLAPNTLELPDIPFDEIPKDALHKVDLGEIMWDELNLEIGHPRRIEKFAINREFKFAGKPDLVAPVNNVYTLVDLKTSREVRENHKLQMGGYHELLDRTPEQAMLVSLHPNERGNSHLRAHTVVIPRKDLDEYADRFIEMAKEFHRRGLVEELIKKNGITHG
jgi:hypothetical protein